MWGVIRDGVYVHVYPLDEVHSITDYEYCACGATEEIVYGGIVVVHNSLDGREFTEWKSKIEQ